MTRIKRGQYEIKMHPGGGCTIYGPGIRKQGYYLQSDEKLREKCQQVLDEGRPGFPRTLKNRLSYRGILECGRRSTTAGKQALGINGPYVDTKRGKVRSGIEVSDEEIKNAIRTFWNPDKIEAFQRGEDVELGNITGFIEKYRREYNSAQTGDRRKKGGFRVIFESVYPGLYEQVVSRVTSSAINLEALGEKLRLRFCQGLPLDQVYLRYSLDPEERILYNQILTLTKNPPEKDEGLFGKRKRKQRTFTEVVAWLSGLNEQDIRLVRGSRNFLGGLTEELIHFFFRWASLLNLNLGEHTPSGEIHREGLERQFEFDGKTCQADLRVQHGALEVKSGLGALQGKELDAMLQRYTPQVNLWLTGEPIDPSTVVFHARQSFYVRSIQPIKDSGMRVIEYEWFHKKLRQLVEKIKSKYLSDIQEVRPRIANLDYLILLSEELILKPNMILRPCSVDRRKWSLNILKNLAKKAQELQNGS